jgi:hypothetical protein
VHPGRQPHRLLLISARHGERLRGKRWQLGQK